MKTRFVLLIMLIIFSSCERNNKLVSDSQKKEIIGEVSEVVKTMYTGAEAGDFETIQGVILDSPDFIYTSNGNTLDYQEFVDNMKPVFDTLINQKSSIIDEKYIILDNSKVIYTATSKWIMNFKDGRAVLQNPWVIQFIFKEIDGDWKIINAVESGYQRSSLNEEISNPLNQRELMNQFIGSWRCELAEDSISYSTIEPCGKGWEGLYRIESNGKVVVDNKILSGYFYWQNIAIQCFIEKEYEYVGLSAYYFISEDRYIHVPYKSITNPDNAEWRIEGEFISQDTVVSRVFNNGELIGTQTDVRIK